MRNKKKKKKRKIINIKRGKNQTSAETNTDNCTLTIREERKANKSAGEK